MIQDVPRSGIVIDLTTPSPPVVKQEPVDNSSMTTDKGKARMVDIIDLTMDSDDDN